MPEQLGMTELSELFLPPDERAEKQRQKERLDQARNELQERLVEIAEYHTHKEMACRLGREGKSGQGVVSQALKRENRNKFDLIADLPVWVASAPNDALVETIASWRQEPASGEEVASALVEAAREFLGPEAHKGLMRATKRQLNRHRRLRRVG